MIIAVQTCREDFRFVERCNLSKDTWIARMLERYPVEIFDGARLGVSDKYQHLPQKVQAIFRWAVAEGHDYLMKIDDDCYLTKAFEFPRIDYGGIVMPPTDDGSPRAMARASVPGTHPHAYASGGAYVISARAMAIMAQCPITDWAEDRWVGNTLARHGIPVQAVPGWTWLDPTKGLDPILREENVLLSQLETVHNIHRAHAFYVGRGLM